MQGTNSFYISSTHVLINNLEMYYYIRKPKKKEKKKKLKDPHYSQCSAIVPSRFPITSPNEVVPPDLDHLQLIGRKILSCDTRRRGEIIIGKTLQSTSLLITVC